MSYKRKNRPPRCLFRWTNRFKKSKWEKIFLNLGPLCHFSKATATKAISYFDIVSLYPSVNYHCSYPVGNPEIIHPKDINVYWEEPEDMEYEGEKIKGILKVRVIPPKKLYLPVIPLRLPNDNRLLFTNCGECPKYYAKRSTKTDR